MTRQEPVRRLTTPEAILAARPARAIVSSDFSVIPQEHSMLVRHLDQKDLAVRWNISARTLERWRWVGEGPRFVKIGGRVRYRLEDVEAFEAQQTRASTSANGDAPRPLSSTNDLCRDSGTGHPHQRGVVA